MTKWLKQIVIVMLVAFAAAQFASPPRANPPTDASRTIAAQMGTASGLVAVLDRACGDCHSNQTAWPWYTRVVPMSWVMARGVAEGRKAVNFSEWAAYPPDVQRQLLIASCRDVSQGRMRRAHDTSVIEGPMMFGEGVDFGHTCMRWVMKLTGGMPT